MSNRSVFAPPMRARHGDTRRVDDVRLNAVPAKPAGQPEAVTAGLECDGNAINFATSSDCLVSPPLQQLQQRAFVHCQFLQRMPLETRYNPSDEPTRLTHLDNRDERAFWVERGQGSAQVIGLSHAAPSGCVAAPRSHALPRAP